MALVSAPRLLLEAARLIAIYMTIRLIAFAVLYLGALGKTRRTEARSKAQLVPGLPAQESVHHLVIIPNFNEPPEILIRTLASLSDQVGPARHFTVVLAMEAGEPDAFAKARSLQALYRSRFSHVMVTYHPAGLPGEIQGKGTNAAWAARAAREELVSRRDIPLEQIVVTVADSDAVFHPDYFAELARCFTSDPRRYSKIWQAPILTDMDIWQAHPVIRLLTFFSNAISLGDYHSWEPKSPYSTYSLSLKLLEDVGYWDPAIIAEDVNLFMRAFFRKGGQVSIQRIYLPVRSNPVLGASLWHAAAIFYAQKVRHGLGGAEVGYLLQKWDHHPPATPFFEKVRRLLKLIHDHLFFSTAGFVVALGTLVSIVLDHTAVITYPPASFSPLFFLCLNLLAGVSLLSIWWIERSRLGRAREGWTLKALVGEAVSFAFFPLLFFLLFNLPGLHAQTRLLLGRPFTFDRTPKWFDSRVGE